MNTPKLSTLKGFVLYRGVSPLDGSDFVVIAVLKSGNTKTGNMVQIFILRADQDPVAAIKSGADVTVCGDCIHRKQADGTRSCYVNVGQSVLSVWRAWKRGVYVENPSTELIARALKGRRIRWGSYGDPSIIPAHIVALWNEHADGWTGYTPMAPAVGAMVPGHISGQLRRFRRLPSGL